MGRRNPASLMVLVDYSCQLNCAYCLVDRAPRSMPVATLRKAVNLLITSTSQKPQLRFFGGEPLLRFDLIREAIEYAEKKGRVAGKDLRFNIVTNGLLLDEEKLRWLSGRNVEIMYSMDGTAESHREFRRAVNGKPYRKILLRNLRSLQRSGLDYFVNTVVTPGRMDRAKRDLSLLARLGVRRVQICYRVGVPWSTEKRIRLVSFFRKMLKAPPRVGPGKSMEIMNLHNDCEPVMLSDEILADTDGALYLDGAIFLERRFPGLRSVMRLGSLGRVRRLETLYRSRQQVFDLFVKRYPPGTPEGRLFADNVRVGMDLRKLVGTGAKS